MALDWALLSRYAIFSGWALTFGTSIVAAVRAPEFLAASGPGVAVLEASAGDVQIRDGGSPLWLEGVGGQQLSSGTIVATGPRTRALVHFESGHAIEIGENSQVVIERPQADSKVDAVVNLVKGTIDSRLTESSRPTLTKRRLVIKAGTQRILLRDKEDRAKVARAPGAATPVVIASAGAPIQQDVRSRVTHTIAVAIPPPAPAMPPEGNGTSLPAPAPAPAPFAATPIAPPAKPAVPVAPAPPMKAVPLAAIEAASLPPPPPPPQQTRVHKPPRIIAPTQDVTYWTPHALTSQNSLRVPIVVSALQKGAPGRPALEIHRPNGERQTVIASPRGERHRLVAMVDVKSSEPVVLKPTIAADDAAMLRVAPARAMKLRVRSLANAPKNQEITILLRRLAAKSGDGLIAERADFDPDEASVNLRLAEGGDLPKLAPFLRGSGGFAIRPGRLAAARSGFHVVRNGQIAATLKGDVEPKAVLALLESLGGSLAFSGKMASYRRVLPAARSVDDLVVLTQEGLRVDLHPGLLNGHAAAKSIAAQHGVQFFVGKPDTIIPEPKTIAAPGAAPQMTDWGNPGSSPASPRRFVFVESTHQEGAPVFLRLDAEAFNAQGLFQAVDGTEALLAYLLNHQQQGVGAAANSPATRLSLILGYSDADAVVFAPTKGRWDVATVVDGKVVGLGSAEPPASREDAPTIHAWLSRVLGSEGVILERRGTFALALCSMLKGRPAQQGVTSSQAIVEVIEATAGRCLLRNLLGLPSAGDKILFE